VVGVEPTAEISLTTSPFRGPRIELESLTRPIAESDLSKALRIAGATRPFFHGDGCRLQPGTAFIPGILPP